MAISTIDLVAPFDPTSYTSITGAQLLQLVSGLSPFTGVGFMLATMDVAGIPSVPNAAVTTKWQNYMWLRVSATYVTAYIWNPNGATDVTFLNWVTVSSASIGPGTIQGFQIAANTIPATAIISISSAQITGSVVPGWLAQLNLAQTAYASNGLVNNNSLVFGDLAGAGSTVAQPVIAPLAVTQGKLALQSVAGNSVALAGQIKDGTITTLQLLSNGSAASTPLLIGAVDPAINITIPTTSIIGIPLVGSSTQAVAAGDVLAVAYNKTGYKTVNRAILNLTEPTVQAYGQVPYQAAAGIIYGFVNPQGANAGAPFGRVLQIVETDDNTKYTNSGNVNPTGAPNYNATGVVGLTGLATTFTPLSAASTLFIEINVPVYIQGTSYAFIGLYTATGATAPLATAACYGSNATVNGMTSIVLKYHYAPGATTAITFKAAFGVSANAGFVNSIDGSTTVFGGIISSIKITEYI